MLIRQRGLPAVGTGIDRLNHSDRDQIGDVHIVVSEMWRNVSRCSSVV